mmetsp:Transcript_68121/g.197448  ORF Transcript_68121/g.197448 Transcript_68121/m.197448 type:complete len:298 (+) Transcript_68121:634-1527(+)
MGRAEALSGAVPLALRLPGVHLEHVDLGLREELGVQLGQARCGEEDHDLVVLGQSPHLGVDGRPQKLRHVLRVGDGNALIDLIRRHLLARPHGVNPLVLTLQRQVRDLVHGIRERRGEERALAMLRPGQRLQNLEDGVAEAEVQQLIGLVQGEEVQPARALAEARGVVEVILQPPGSRHEDVHGLLAQYAVVVGVLAAAVEACHGQAAVVAEEQLRLDSDLGGELTGGRNDDRGNGAADARAVAPRPLHDGQQEGEGLARACLRPGDHVLALDHGPDRRGLHPGHELVAEALGEGLL